MSQIEHDFEAVLNRKENAEVLAYVHKEQPSAHADMVELLINASDKLAGTGYFSPDPDNHAYYLAHTSDGVVYAAAMGLSALAFRLPNQAISGALQKGGELFRELGINWVMFNPFWPERDTTHLLEEMQHWSRLAYHYALGLDKSDSP